MRVDIICLIIWFDFQMSAKANTRWLIISGSTWKSWAIKTFNVQLFFFKIEGMVEREKKSWMDAVFTRMQLARKEGYTAHKKCRKQREYTTKRAKNASNLVLASSASIRK